MNQTTVNGSTTLFCDYYKQWITVYKEGAIRPVTMNKYHMAHHWLEKLVPKLTLGDLDRFAYQKLLNDYASEHERQTTMDFHHHLKCAILDAVDEGLIQRDPTRKAIIKGKTPREKKPKYLNQYELHKLLDDLDLKSEINLDWLLLLIAKTGMRFSEALALTPKDFDLFFFNLFSFCKKNHDILLLFSYDMSIMLRFFTSLHVEKCKVLLYFYDIYIYYN